MTHKHWYDLDGLFLHAYNFTEKITPFDIPTASFYLTVALGVPLLIGLSSIRRQRPQVRQSVGLGFWFAALMGNKGEVWLFGHATDWIWVQFRSFSAFTNLADLMLVAALVTLSLGRGPKDVEGSSDSTRETGLSSRMLTNPFDHPSGPLLGQEGGGK
jgi:hypothetical protein